MYFSIDEPGGPHPAPGGSLLDAALHSLAAGMLVHASPPPRCPSLPTRSLVDPTLSSSTLIVQVLLSLDLVRLSVVGAPLNIGGSLWEVTTS